MQLDITIKNYRCFPDSYPARISIRKGFTALLGTNNSGKSALLRFFFEFRELFRALQNPNVIQGLFRGHTMTFGWPKQIIDPTEAFSYSNNRNLILEFGWSFDNGSPGITNTELRRLSLQVLRNSNTFRLDHAIAWDRTQIKTHEQAQFDGTSVLINNQPVLSWTYREATLTPLINTMYLGAFRNAINIGGREEYFDIQIGQQFLRTWKTLKTGNVKLQAQRTHSLTEDIRRLFDYASLEINTSEDDTTLQMLVNGRPLRLDEVGSGISQFILVLANAATRSPAYIMIDEPEVNLHPSLQMDFLTTLANYSTEGVIFSTHSIGLARSAGGQIYSLRRLSEGQTQMRRYEETPHLAEFLGEMGFAGYKEIGFDRVLLVEGATDIATIQQFLRPLKKNHQVLPLHLGGSNFINGNREQELAEVRRISDRIYALIDSEKDSQDAELSPDRKAFQGSCERLKINCHVLALLCQ